jgi:RHS repeat-associated protein
MVEMTATISKVHVTPIRRCRFEGLVALMLLAAFVAPLSSQHSSFNRHTTSGTEGCGPYSWDAAGRASGSNGYAPGARTNSSTVVLLGSVNLSSPTPTVTVSRNGVAINGVSLDANGWFNFVDRPGQGWQTYTVQATQAGTGNNGSNATAQQIRQVYVPPANESLSYDRNGNRAGDSRWTLSWNDFGQLTEAKDANPSGSTDILFIYDYKGRMVQREKIVSNASGVVVSTSFTTTLYDGWKPVLQIDTNGAGSELARRIYTWGPDVSGTIGGAAGIGGLIELVEKKGGTISKRLAIHDGKGNVTGWVDESSGARVATYSYGPFGEPVNASGSAMADCPLRWQTKLYDEDLGLYYFGKRWYDSKTRTWISPDPLREDGGVNVTCYCENQPFDEHDPIGLGAALIIRTPDEYARVQRDINNGVALFKGVKIHKGFQDDGSANATWNNAELINSFTDYKSRHIYGAGVIRGASGIWFFDNADHLKSIKEDIDENYAIIVAYQVASLGIGSGLSGLGEVPSIGISSLPAPKIATAAPEIPAALSESGELNSTGLPASVGPDVVADGEESPAFESQVFSLSDVAEDVPLLLDAGKVADHHIFPRQFEGFFVSNGINIDDFTITLGKSSHLRGVHGNGLGSMPGRWNSRWADFIANNPNASQVEIYKFGGSLMEEFGINHIPIHPYKK